MLLKPTAVLAAVALLGTLPIATSAAVVNPDAVTCNTVVACIYGSNVSTDARADIGLEGLSLHGFGLVGVTSGASASAATAVAGLYGKDQGQTTYNSGVLGASSYGAGVKGTGKNGVLGIGSNGVAGISTASSGAGVIGEGTGAIGGLFADLGAGFGLAGESQSGTALYLQANSVTASGGMLAVGTGPGNLGFYFDADGNEYLSGSLTLGTSGMTFDTTTTTRGRTLATYSARTASPTLEDVGEATLTAGAAHVTLDPAYASTISTDSYLVFITPEGDSNSLYTTAHTASGFDVREHAGHSSLTFAYRIVAKPLGSTAKRLAIVNRPALKRRDPHLMR